MLTHPSGLFSGDYISAPRDAGPKIFTRPISPINCISSRTWGTGRPHVGLYPIFLVLIWFQTVPDSCMSMTCRQVLVSSSLAMVQQLLWKTGWRARNKDSSAGVQSAVIGWRDGGGCSTQTNRHTYIHMYDIL